MMEENRSGRRSSSKTEIHTARADELTQTDRYVTLRRNTFNLRLFYVTAQNILLDVLQYSKTSTGKVPCVSAGYKEEARKAAYLKPCFLYLGQAFRYSPKNAFYIFNQQIYFII